MTQKSQSPLPAQGGSYVRAKDGSLTRTNDTETALPANDAADGKTAKEG